MKQLHIQSTNSETEFWDNALQDIVFSIKETLKTKSNCRLGLAGGNTPRPLYEKLAEQKLDWERIHIILIDERYVPSDHPQSNLRMIRQSLLNKVPIPPTNIHSWDSSLKPESAAKEMARQLIELSHERFPIFDLLVLGAGSDGHIASLFEGDAALNSTNYATTATAQGQETEQRLTLTRLALKDASRAILLLKGDSKRPVLDSLKGKGSLPLTALKDLCQDVPLNLHFLGSTERKLSSSPEGQV